MSTNASDSATATVATSEHRSAKPQRTRKSAKSAKAKPAKKSRQSKAEAKPKTRRANKKADVIDLMRRPSGATLTELMESTGWQRHTVRGFLSILGSKGGLKIESSKKFVAGDSGIGTCWRGYAESAQVLFVAAEPAFGVAVITWVRRCSKSRPDRD